MKLHALGSFVCPISHATLSLLPFETRNVALSCADEARCKRLGIESAAVATAVKEGVLYCDESRTWYPIINYVPVLLDYPTELQSGFREQHASHVSIVRRYNLPSGSPRPGERLTQRSFTKEWKTLEAEKISFGFTPEQRDSRSGARSDNPAARGRS